MSIEEKIVRCCSPALTGIKTANLVTIKISDCGECLAFLNSLNTLLSKKGVCFLPLRCCKDYVLVFAYNRLLLSRQLQNASVKKFLMKQGYSVFCDIEKILCDLVLRFSVAKDFPHEIGIFLGYPLDDVKGFIANKGKNYKISGQWKVYGDEKKARCLFAKYAECSKRCTEQFLNGSSIEQICKSA